LYKPVLFLSTSVMAGLAIAQVNSSTLLANFGKAMKDAKTIKADYTIQTIHAGGAEAYSVVLKKPNLMRIESPNVVIVADGQQITTFDKSEKTYYKRPETESDIKQIFSNEEVHLWAGFFDANAYKPVKSKDTGNRTVKGGTMATVEAAYDAQERKVITYFLNPQDYVARKAQIDFDKKDPSRSISIVVDTKGLELNGDVSKDAFVFTPPADSREMSLAEMNSAKWYYDLDEAKKVAAASGRKIFVDFFATWCGPCKRLEHDCFNTEQFKKFSSKLVFCRIDVDDQKSVAQAYNITAMPTQDILAADGSVLNQTVGYADPETFFNFLKSSVGN